MNKLTKEFHVSIKTMKKSTDENLGKKSFVRATWHLLTAKFKKKDWMDAKKIWFIVNKKNPQA